MTASGAFYLTFYFGYQSWCFVEELKIQIIQIFFYYYNNKQKNRIHLCFRFNMFQCYFNEGFLCSSFTSRKHFFLISIKTCWIRFNATLIFFLGSPRQNLQYNIFRFLNTLEYFKLFFFCDRATLVNCFFFFYNILIRVFDLV